jgi:hypothetical protein
MRTRSQSQTPSAIASGFGTVQEEKEDIYEVVIDFDGASAAWRANKRRMGNGCYKYVCESITKTGKKCTKDCITGSTCCNIHSK